VGNLNTEETSVPQDLLAEFSSAVTAHQPELMVTSDKNLVLLEGKFIISASEGPFDTYDIQAMVPPAFPLEEPAVFETGGRIPKVVARHVFEDLGNCCLGVWEEWLLRSHDTSAAAFLAGPLHDYFLSQSYYEAKGEWPFGQRSHGNLGVLEAYCDVLGIDPDLSKARAHLSLLSKKSVKGHAMCPCGSGLRLRHCHRDKIDELRARISSAIAKRMLLKLADD